MPLPAPVAHSSILNPRRLAPFVLFVACATAGSAAAQLTLQPTFLPANEMVMQNYSPEFPPIGAMYAYARAQRMAEHTALLLRDAPASPEAFEMAVYMEQSDQALDVLRRVIQTALLQMARAFELLNVRPQIVGRVVGSGVTDPLPGLIVDARAQLSRLPRENAARAERALVVFETRGGDPAGNPRRSIALRAFISRYQGTDAALEAEVDLITAS
jgi:hypothetical protein